MEPEASSWPLQGHLQYQHARSDRVAGRPPDHQRHHGQLQEQDHQSQGEWGVFLIVWGVWVEEEELGGFMGDLGRRNKGQGRERS